MWWVFIGGSWARRRRIQAASAQAWVAPATMAATLVGGRCHLGAHRMAAPHALIRGSLPLKDDAGADAGAVAGADADEEETPHG
jgi:hypothetical protein